METIKLRDFLDFAFLSNLSLSPDGSCAAYLKHTCDVENDGYATSLMVTAMKDAGAEAASGRKRPVFCWESAGVLLYGYGENGVTCFRRYDVAAGESAPAFTVPHAVHSIVSLTDGRCLFAATTRLYPEDVQDDDCVIISELPTSFNGLGFISGTRTSLFLYDPLTGDSQQITPRFYDVFDYEYCPAQGKVVISGESFESKRIIEAGLHLYDLETGSFDEVLKPGVYRTSYASMIGDKVFFAGTLGLHNSIMENPNFYLLDPTDGSITEYAAPDFYIGGLAIGSDCRFGGGINNKVVGDTVYFTSAHIGQSPLMRVGLDGKLEYVSRLNGSVDHFDVANGVCAFIGMEGTDLQELYTLDLKTGEAVCFTDWNGGYTRTHSVVEPEPLYFETGEGEASGWVMKPVGFDPSKRYPAILDIHGGPKSAYGPIYYHEMQVWANAGYFVFFCNPRGSDGHGDAFSRIIGITGTKDYDDLMHFTDLVLDAYPQIDPSRVGVTGGSYGGFMTNWIVGHTDRFRCAASQRSIGDWIVHEYNCDTGYWVTSRYYPPNAIVNAPKAWDDSPAKHDIHCKTPILFIHSDQDTRCSLPEALASYSAAVRAGATVRMCLFHGETHELSRSGKPYNRVKRLEEITVWMDKYLKEDAQ